MIKQTTDNDGNNHSHSPSDNDAASMPAAGPYHQGQGLRREGRADLRYILM